MLLYFIGLLLINLLLWIYCNMMMKKNKMEKCFDESKIAKLTGTAIQDDETFKAEGGFVPERDQFYFEMKQGNHVFMIGFKDLLICLRLLEKMKEIPEIGEKWWQHLATLYGNDIYMFKCDETN